MGMDVCGRAPTSEVGKDFRASIHAWHPLADMIEILCPDEAAGCNDWHSNDGGGLDAAGAMALGVKLEALLASGAVDHYFAHDVRGEAAPENRIAKMLGAAVGPGANFVVGSPASSDTVRRFAAFLKASGGFAIW